jgi:hypothetical protein
MIRLSEDTDKENTIKTLLAGSNDMPGVLPARGERARGRQSWAPYAAMAWSLLYAALGIY